MTASGPVLLTLRYDVRAPACGPPAAELYQAALEQCAWAEVHGFDAVVLSEHHGADDGYRPSPLVLASAIAGLTTRLRIMIDAPLAPLYDPIRLAEDLAVLDLVSSGRVDVAAGATEVTPPRPLPGPHFVHVADDPDAAWARIAPHALHDARADTAVADADALRGSGGYLVLTPDECVEMVLETGSLTLHPLMGGLPPDLAWESLDLIASDVLPQLK